MTSGASELPPMPQSTTLCIPSTSKVFVGEVVNQGAGGTYTIFNPSAPTAPPVQYNQATILDSLASELNYMLSANPAPYSHISGIVVWQLGNDYAPNLYGDTVQTELPASGLMLRVAHVYWELSEPDDARETCGARARPATRRAATTASRQSRRKNLRGISRRLLKIAR